MKAHKTMNQSSQYKICFATPYSYSLYNEQTYHNFGGAEVRSYLFATAISAYMYTDVHVVVGNHGQPVKENYGRITVHNDLSFDLRSMTKQKNLFYRLLKGIERRLKHYYTIGKQNIYYIRGNKSYNEKFLTYKRIDADIYCLFGVSNFTSELAANLQCSGKKVVLFIAGDSDLNFDYLKGNDEKNYYGSSYYLCNALLSNIKYVVTQNQLQADLLKNYNGKNSKVILNPVCMKPDGYSKGIINKKYFLWIGKADHVKNPYAMINIAKHCPGYQFVMIMSHSRACIYAEIETNKPDNVTIINYVPYRRVDGYINNAIALVNTSLHEGFPNTFLQAGALGVPIISLNVNPNNFITDYNCGLFAEGDTNSIINLINNLHSHEEVFKLWSGNVMCYVNNNHDINKVTRELMDYFEGILSDKSV